jgi:nucleoside-diphosphate-sugar epimerase
VTVFSQRIAILGGTGFIGGHVAAEFAEAGFDVACFGSRDFDLCDAAAVGALTPAIGPEDVLFLAAVIPPRLGRDRATMLRNIAMAETVCRFLERAACGALVYMRRKRHCRRALGSIPSTSTGSGTSCASGC